MTQNNSNLKSALVNGFDWNDDLTSSLSLSDGGIVLLPFELDDQDESHNDKQSACISYIESISKPNKIFFITTSKWASTIIPLIHHYRQIDAIFILSDKKEYLEYDQIYFKIIGFYSNEKELIDSIHEQILLERQQYLSFSFYSRHQKSTRDLSKESASFLWLLLFKDIIVRMRSENNHEQAKQELIEQLKQLYRNNRTQLKLIEHFNQTYKTTDNEPLRWYTGKPFLHKQINRALRTEDIQMLQTFRYIISDISHCLKQEFEFIKEFVDQITLYRGLRVTNEELEKLKKNIGKMISTNGFLSTSRSRRVALMFAGKSKEDKQSVLFEIECDLNELQNDSVIFADISRFSEIRDEDEILFDIGAAFIMETIFYDNELDVWLLKLKATDEATKIGQFYLERNTQLIENTSVTLTFGILLHMMGQYNQALDYFESLFDNSTEDKAFIQFFIGIAQFELGKYIEAFECLKHAQTMFESRQPPTFVSEIYTYMGYILSRTGSYDKALKVHLECLTLAEKRVKYDPYYVAACLGRIGNVHLDKCEYDLAMNYYMKSNHLLSIYPSDHIECGKNLVNIGSVHYLTGHIDHALMYYEQGLKILEKYIGSDHTPIVAVLNNLGNIRREQGDYSEALKYFQKCLSVEMQSFPEGHLDIASTFDQIGHLLCLQENYDEGLENYFKALNIHLDLHNDTHINYAMTLYNIGYTYAKIGKDLDIAMNYARQALQIIEHNQLMMTSSGGKCLLLVGSILHLQSNDDQALEFVSKALKVLEDVYDSHRHPDIALCLTQLGEIYLYKNMFSLALESHKEALTIREHFLPTDTTTDQNFSLFRYKDIADSLSNIARVYFQMKEIELALNFCWKSLAIKTIYYQPTDYEELIAAMKSVAQALSGLEKWDDALTCYLQIDRMITSDEEKTLNLSNIGQCYREKKNYLIALDYYRQALAIVSTMDISNPTTNIASATIKQDMNEMICECVIKVFTEHGHHFCVCDNSY